MGLVIREATEADIAALSPFEKTMTMKAWAAEADGKLIALGGFAVNGGRYYAFCDMTSKEAAPHKMTLMRAAHRFIREAKESGVRQMYAIIDYDEPRSMAWATSLGFFPDPINQNLYRWSAKEWQP